jgi:hypothetical protein
MEFPLPFRWDLQQRSTVEGMLEGDVAATYAGFTDELLACCAGIVGRSQGADLCFVGRSLESVFDHLGGLLLDTSWLANLALLPLSLWRDPDGALDTPPRKRALRDYLTAQAFDPASIARRERPVALVDLVSTGATLGGIVEFLHAWCTTEGGGDWSAVARKLRVVGLTYRKKTSPNTHRWAQHAAWVKLLGKRAIKNVSAPHALYRYLGDYQPKLAPSFAPDRWGDLRVTRPEHTADRLTALRLAVKLFDLGRLRDRRDAFAAALADEHAMKERWLRALVVELSAARTRR